MSKNQFVKESSPEINNNNQKIRGNMKINCRRQSATWRDRVITVMLMNKKTVQVNVQPKASYASILSQLCAQIGLTELTVFGLAFRTDSGEFHFVDRANRVCKRLFSMAGTSKEGEGEYKHLYLRVQHYVEVGYNFRTEDDKTYYFEQLKENFLRYGFNYPDDRCFLLASYAIHATKTNWRDFDPREYFPAWVLKQYGTHFVRRHMPTIAPEKMSASQAMNTYIKELCTPSPYTYNMTIYKLQSSKSKHTNDTRLGICHQGLEVYEVNGEGYLSYLTGCLWKDIKSINVNKRRLALSVNGRVWSFYACSEEWSRILAHSLKLSQLNYLGEQEHDLDLSADLIEDVAFRESYIYSDQNDLEWEYGQSTLGTLPSPSNKGDDESFVVMSHSTPSRGEPIHNKNRLSIVSTSTMTSGIVSDKTCISTENSQEDLLSSSTRQSSCDSLLAPKAYQPVKTRIVTVQRAISEPSKKFEQLRLQVRNLPQCLPRRAVSDETVDDHDYENIVVVRETLGLQAPTKRRTQSSASHQFVNRSPLGSGQSSPRYLSPHHNQLIKTPRKLSLTPGGTAVPDPAVSQHRYSLISNSPSMEQLLINYTPPPSYNESHARQREMLIAGGQAASQESMHSLTALPTPTTTTGPIFHAASSSLNEESVPVTKQKRQSSMPSTEPISHTLAEPPSSDTSNKLVKDRCNCLKLSHPEIDKLRTEVKDLMSLPLISALCNDKELQRTANHCNCGQQATSPRPISWHCERPLAFTFPTHTELSSQPVTKIH